MTRFSPYPRRAYRALFTTWARRNVKLISSFAAVVFALIAFETAVILLMLPRSWFSWWLLGALQATLVAMGLYVTNAAFLADRREAIWQLHGAWGEEATRDELRRAKRKRLIWGWVDSVALQAGDLDHLVITRHGGLIAIDSKWRTDGNDAAAMVDSAAKSRLRAQAVARSLLKGERGTHRARGHAVTVRPLVVIWGPAQHTMRDGDQDADIPFVGGRRLLSWLSDVNGEQVSKAAAKEIITALKKFRASTHAADIKKRR
jgi:hypothetical protein